MQVFVEKARETAIVQAKAKQYERNSLAIEGWNNIHSEAWIQTKREFQDLYISYWIGKLSLGQTAGWGCFSTLDDPKRYSAERKKRFDELLQKDQLANKNQNPLVDAEMEQAEAQEISDVEEGNAAPLSGSAGSTAGQVGSPAGSWTRWRNIRWRLTSPGKRYGKRAMGRKHF